MDNKKLLKFLYKDIAEIEELVTEKGSEGFDEFEVEFIQSRFKGAKQLIQILSEKENKQLKKIRPRPVEETKEEEEVLVPKKEVEVEEKLSVEPTSKLSEEEEKRLQSLSDFEEEIKEEELEHAEDPVKVEAVKEVEVSVPTVVVQPEVEEEFEESVQAESQTAEEEVAPVEANESNEDESKVELEDEAEVDEANNRLGDSFSKEKSVNEFLGNDGSKKLEYKISNSPVDSIKSAIGINDRYQYIRELFEGNGETFSKAVTELDNMNTIQEAVTYLQQNYKWKKNDTSLKFVNLVKRRFPNG